MKVKPGIATDFAPFIVDTMQLTAGLKLAMPVWPLAKLLMVALAEPVADIVKNIGKVPVVLAIVAPEAVKAASS